MMKQKANMPNEILWNVCPKKLNTVKLPKTFRHHGHFSKFNNKISFHKLLDINDIFTQQVKDWYLGLHKAACPQEK